MAMRTIGDQARAYTLQNSSLRLKNTLHTLTDEMTSGRVSDVAQRLGGNTTEISGIESRLRVLKEYQQVNGEVAHRLDSMQIVIRTIQSSATSLSDDLLLNATAASGLVIKTQSHQAADAFRAAVGHLNIEVGGRYLFGGIETDHAPLRDGQRILDELITRTASLTTAGDIEQFVSNWFDAPAGGGGFVDFAYLGSQGNTQGVAITEQDQVVLNVDATHPAVVSTLKGLSMTVLSSHGAIDGQLSEQRALLHSSSLVLLGAAHSLTSTQSQLGLSEDRVARAEARNSSALLSLETARNTITSADPFETASALAEVQTQMETLYSITARLSNLKLVDYLR